MLKFLRILVDFQQRYAALKLRLVKKDHVPQSAMSELSFSRQDWVLVYEVVGV